MYALAMLFGSLAILIPYVSAATAYTLAAVLAVCGLIAVLFLEGAPYERQVKLDRPSSAS
jgi:hypothetical protein